VVYPEVWDKIPHKHVLESVSLAKFVENASSNGKTNITQQNELGILGFVQRTRWVEVVNAGGESIDLSFSTSLGLLLMIVVSSDVADEVHGPSEKLLTKRVDNGSDWSFLGQLMNLVSEFSNTACVVLASLWDENHVTFHVTGGLVVLSVGNLP
jgi:hypothetical protein